MERNQMIAAEQQSAQSSPLAKLALTGVALAVLLYLSWQWRANQKVEQLRVEGTQVLTEKELLGELDSALKNKSLSDVELAVIREKIKKRDYVQSAIVKRDGVGGISIKVEERRPIAAIINEGGEIEFLDNEGIILPYERYSGITDVPLVRGLFIKEKLDSAGLNNVKKLLSELQQQADGMLYQATSEIIFQPQTKNFLLVSTESGVEINLGRSEEISVNLEKLLKFWVHAQQEKKFPEIAMIDCRWKDQIIIKSKT